MPDEMEVEIDLTDHRMVRWRNPERFLFSTSLKVTGFNSQDIGFILAYRNLKKLEIWSGTWRIRADVRVLDEPKLSYLHLVDTDIDRYLDGILLLFKELRELIYFRPSSDWPYDTDTMGDALREHGKQLEHLELHNESLMPFYNPIGSLAPLSNLRKLDCYLEFLIDYLENPVSKGYEEYEGAPWDEEVDEPPDYEEIYQQRGDWSLVKVLPPSLEWLHIDIEEPKIYTYYNTWERYGAKFYELATSDQFPRLQHIIALGLAPVGQKLQEDVTGWNMVGEALIRTLLTEEPAE
jgi:hypothetical protein